MGKFGERVNKTETIEFDDRKKFHEFLESGIYDISSVGLAAVGDSETETRNLRSAAPNTLLVAI